MRRIININENWHFTKDASHLPSPDDAGLETVSVPHCWNAVDGQDGGNDYYRGLCYYLKTLSRAELPVAERYFLEVNGASSSAYVYLNGRQLASHDGGYSTFRVDITDALEEENTLVIGVDNAANDYVYPQNADFTFYGGLYRDVNILCTTKTHFDTTYYGGSGIAVTPVLEGADARVTVETFITDYSGQEIAYTVTDREGNPVFEAHTKEKKIEFTISNAHLWNGRKDPYLYTIRAEILENGEAADNVSARFGCRSFRIDPEKGFFLNGAAYPLRGVSRHQDRWEKGNALSRADHEEDMDLICEMGANTIRLAHYQHEQYFYDLCDQRGMVVWAEIPYISTYLPGGEANAEEQMKELIIQNYNHPSIVVWGLSNEITMGGEDSTELIAHHKKLKDLVHSMDATRLTTMAHLTTCKTSSELVQIPDVIAYNHYFGWYGGETGDNGPWFDDFHKKYPNIPIGCSEYGCEALNWHSSQPMQGDYTEEYQAYYHEELIKQFFTRPYLWATYVWNMFDFGADARAEGGENGQNHKGLVTIDRKYKKDSFYAYKAWLSEEPFVHICGKRYVDRVEDVTKVTVYSNLPEVELFAGGVSLGKQKSAEHFFYFQVPNAGETRLKAVAGDCTDKSTIRKVDVFNEDYRLKEKGAILNWFDITMPEGRFSINDKVGDIMATFRGKFILLSFAKSILGGKKKKKDSGSSGVTLSKGLIKMVSSFTILRLSSLMGGMGMTVTKEQLLELNQKLNKVKKK